MKTLGEIYEDSIIMGQINPKIFKILIAKYLKDNDLFKYFNGLIFDEKQETIGCYNRQDLILSLNLSLIKQNSEIMDDYKSIVNRCGITYPGTELLYYYFLDTLYHELEHIKQNKIINHISIKDPIFTVLESSYNFATSENYFKNHDLFPHEHSANVSGIKNAIAFCSKHNAFVTIPEDINVAKNLISDYYIKDNLVISPVEQLYKDELLKDILYITEYSNIDDYTKLFYGLPINYELFNQINQIMEKKEKIKTLRGYKSC